MRNRVILIIVALLALIPNNARATRVMVVSDIHYMAKCLYEGSDLFIRALRAGDGKLTQHSDELMEALAHEVHERMPDALIVTGDLTFNGEKESHIALASWFESIEAEGASVWVIPGNHDINVTTARGFNVDSWYYTESVTPEAFRSIYADFMKPPEGKANLSYTVEVNDDLIIPMLDVSFYQGGAQTFGMFLASHADWLENTLQHADGATVVTATHHNLLPHTEFLKDSFVMMGNESMLNLMKTYGVRLNLSGHIHAQHIAKSDGVTDAALGAFCTWPHRYALLTLEDGTLTYQAMSLSQDFLPEGFLSESREWAEQINREKVSAALENVSDENRELMADYATRFNLAYFSGTYRSDDPSWKADPAYALWSAQKENIFWQYMSLVMEEHNGDNLYCRIE